MLGQRKGLHEKHLASTMESGVTFRGSGYVIDRGFNTIAREKQRLLRLPPQLFELSGPICTASLRLNKFNK